MFRKFTLAPIVAILAFVLFVPVHAKATDLSSVALVDVEKILSESKAAKSLQTQIQAKKDAFQKEFSNKEKELKATETNLIAQKEKLSAEDFGKKRKAYEEKIIETRQLFQKRRNGLDTGINKAMLELRKAIVESTSKIANDKKIQIVLTRDSVLIADKTLEITPDVLKELDSTKSDVKLTVE